MARSICGFLGFAIVVASLAGCQSAVKEQEAYMDRQRRDCEIAGGYFETNKPGAPDNYTCKGVGNQANDDDNNASSNPPTKCRTTTSTVVQDDGTEVTKSDQVCSSI